MIPIAVSPCLTRLVNAPGFSAHSFAAALDRARQVPTMRLTPMGGGRVRCTSGSGPAEYVVSRARCSCRGHAAHGACKHRAMAIWCDAVGIDVTRETVLGWGTDSTPVTQAMRDAELAAEAA